MRRLVYYWLTERPSGSFEFMVESVAFLESLLLYMLWISFHFFYAQLTMN